MTVFVRATTSFAKHAGFPLAQYLAVGDLVDET
jgi:hypothetical protein